MIIRLVIFVLVLLTVIFKECKAQDILFSINGKKILHKVSDKFLSISIDPVVLLSGSNISFIGDSLVFARHLSPTYLRLVGPTTDFVHFSTNKINDVTNGVSELIFTPSMWQSLNDWLMAANLTPVFGINDLERINGTWDAKTTYQLFDLSKKLNLACHWQLGFDCSNKNEADYVGDLQNLRQIFKDFSINSDWKIVGSDLSKCISEYPGTWNKLFDHLEGVTDAVMWEPPNSLKTNVLSRATSKHKIDLWTTVPKTSGPINFETGLIWAQNIGQAAKLGYSVIFRQPRLQEIFSETSVFWISLFHKTFMGKNVLDVKSNGIQDSVYTYAQCTKNQNKFPKRGAVTIFVVNFDKNPRNISVKIGGLNFKNMEVQSYVLTASNESSSLTALNGEKLTTKLLEKDKLELLPKLRRIRNSKVLTLEIQPESVSFFVLPGARLPACIADNDYDMLLKEIEENQKADFTPEDVKLNSEEFDSDQDFYEEQFEKIHIPRGKKPNLKNLVEDIENEYIFDEIFDKQPFLQKMNNKLDDNQKQMKHFKGKPSPFLQSLLGKKTKSDNDLLTEKFALNDLKEKLYGRFKKTLSPRLKRDINMDLLKRKVGHPTKRTEEDEEEDNDEDESVISLPITPKSRPRLKHNDIFLRKKTKLEDAREEEEKALRKAKKFLSEIDEIEEDFRVPHRETLYPIVGPKKLPSEDRRMPKMGYGKVPENWQYKVAFSPKTFRGNQREKLFDELDYDDEHYLGWPFEDFYSDFDGYESRSPIFRKRRDDVSQKFKRTSHKRVLKEGTGISTTETSGYHYVLGKPYDPSKIKISENQRNQQLKMLKSRLNQFRKNEQKKKDKMKKKVVASTTLKPKNSKIQKRSIYLKNFDYFPYKEYIPKTRNIKEWKPVDILELDQLYNQYFMKNTVPKINALKVIKKRGVDDLDDMMNGIEKDISFDLEYDDYVSIPASNKFNTIDIPELFYPIEANSEKGESTIEMNNDPQQRPEKSDSTTFNDGNKSVEDAINYRFAKQEPGDTEEIAGHKLKATNETIENVQKIRKSEETDWLEKLYEGISILVNKVHRQLVTLLE